MGGVLFIDEAYYLYRPENERDYGQEAIEILLQVMENQRDDLVVILAGYADRMDRFFESNPGFRSRIAHHIDFPDYSDDELLADRRDDARRAELPPDRAAPAPRSPTTSPLRRGQPHFANARSIRNALDRARLRQANRLFETATGPLDAAAPQRPSTPPTSAPAASSPAASTPTGGPNHDLRPQPEDRPLDPLRRLRRLRRRGAAPSRPPAPTGSTSTSWTATSSRTSPSARRW